jgi:hypothetical protein
MSFLLFECMVALGVLLSLAELVSWWAVAALPAAVAAMVKLNDLVSGALSHDARTARAVPARRVLPARYADAGQYGSPDDVTPAFGMPGGAGPASGRRGSTDPVPRRQAQRWVRRASARAKPPPRHAHPRGTAASTRPRSASDRSGARRTETARPVART